MMLPYGKQSISEDDIQSVVRSLRSDFLTCGPEVEAFEREFAAFVGAKQAGQFATQPRLYLQPWYRRSYGYAPGKCPKAEEFYSRALSLPLFPAMNDADVENVIDAVSELSV
jgi:dTDP-4-amino-4,6-dideoxygalactose transaminase